MADKEPVNQCSICLELEAVKLSTTPCHHVFCYFYLKKWVQKNRKVDASGVAKAECPLCRQQIGSFNHQGNRKFKLFPPGQGPNGAEKHRRRFRKRCRPKKKGAVPKVADAAAGGYPPTS